MFGVDTQSNLEDRLRFPQINRRQSNKQTTTTAKLSCTRFTHEEARYLKGNSKAIHKTVSKGAEM